MKRLPIQPSQKHQRAIVGLIAVLLAASPARSQESGISEPPLVIYGKVIHIDQGTTYEVFEGTLAMTLTNTDSGDNTVRKTVLLKPTGEASEFSYRVEFPQRNLPQVDELATTLSVGAEPVEFIVTETTINGVPATPLDSAMATLSTSYEGRTQEHRIDLMVNLPQEDTDSDGIPDWWEETHGFNPLSADDAGDDLDGDGISNLDEFKGGTDPNTSNNDPTMVAKTVAAPEGGTAGLTLTIIDADTADANLELAITSAVGGLTFRDRSGTLTPPATFSYADVLAGDLVIDVAVGTGDKSVPMTVTDTTGANTPVAFEFSVLTFSPANQAPQPAVWLQPSALAGDVAEWADASGNNRDGYQPVAADQPTGSATGAEFDGEGEFLYIDDRLLQLGEFTVFIAARANALRAANQTLFNAGGLNVRLGGSDDPLHTGTLMAGQDDRRMDGPVVPFGSDLQLTISGGTDASFLAVAGRSMFASTLTGESRPASYATIGASQGIFESSASGFFDGAVNEVIVYDTPLDAAGHSRLEDYQLSRWTGLVVWDARNATAPLVIAGHAGERNALNGGWGDDSLAGAELADVLRGGPGRDYLTGNGGGDRFQIFPGHGDDTVVDFSEAAGDILDLTPIFGGIAGTPDQYIRIRTEVVRDGGGGAPSINSVIELDYDGDGSGVDQAITLEGVPLSDADLPRLVGGGRIQLGGPVFPTAVTLAAGSSGITETAVAREITLTRSGNLDATLELALSFVGSATADDDYALSGVTGSGAVRTLSFAPGVSERVIELTPVQDTYVESEEILIAVLPSPQVTSGPAAPLSLTLDDAPAVSIEVLRRYAERLGSVPALVMIHRTGDLGAPLDVELQFDGGAENGLDFLPVSPLLNFPVGVATVEVKVTPSGISPSGDRPLVVQLSIVPAPERFALHSPWTGSVMIVDGIAGIDARTFGGFRQQHFPSSGLGDEALGALDSDSDLLDNLGEYVFGTDPNVADAAPAISIQKFNSDGFVEIHAKTAAGLTDARVELQFSDKKLNNWLPVDDDFIVSHQWLGDGRIKRTYRSRLSAANIDNSGFFRVAITLTPAPQLEAGFGGDSGVAAGVDFLAVSGPVWAPSSDGARIDAPGLAESESSTFETFIDDAFTIDFEWSGDAGHDLVFSIDDVDVATATGTGGWATVNFTTAATGEHVLRWTITRNAGAASESESESLRNFSLGGSEK